MPDHTSRTSDDSSAAKLDGLHHFLLPLVWNPESVTSNANTEAYWQKSFGIVSLKQIATATPYKKGEQTNEARQKEKSIQTRWLGRRCASKTGLRQTSLRLFKV